MYFGKKIFYLGPPIKALQVKKEKIPTGTSVGISVPSHSRGNPHRKRSDPVYLTGISFPDKKIQGIITSFKHLQDNCPVLNICWANRPVCYISWANRPVPYKHGANIPFTKRRGLLFFLYEL